MADDPRVQELLDRLSDSDATPEEVCGSCAELLPVVRDRWRQMCRAREEIDGLFPPEDGSDAGQPDPASLPVIPGYEVEAELGRGGMGVVYRARHVRLNRVVALKMVLAGGPPERERFRREAEAAAALRHPNVVQVHDVGDAGGRPYFTMEYVDGGSLAQRLKGAPLPIREAAGLVLALCGAVEAAHTAGIIHRDLKPSNVLLAPDGTPKVADFGLARRLDGEAGLTRTGAAVGTPSYMAPEQAGEENSVPGPPADVYSLGAILYELLTGRPPFQAGNAAVTIYRVVTQDPVPPSRLNAKVPRDLETICLKCLGKEPRLRYPSAAALGDDLRRFLDGEAISARPEGPVARLVRRARQRPVLAAAVAVAALSTISLVAGGVWAVTERRAAEHVADLKQAAADAERRAVEQATDADLREMEDLLTRSSWPAATAALERAKGRLGGRDSAPLRGRIEQGSHDLELVTLLDDIFFNAHDTAASGRLSFTRADVKYEEAFRAAGFGAVSDAPDVVAARIKASNIRDALVAALDHWSSCAKDPRRKAWVLEVARKADSESDPTGWRTRARDPEIWKDDAALAEIIETASAADQSVPLLLGLVHHLMNSRKGRDPIPLLKRIQQSHPGNVWVNLRLGYELLDRAKNPHEAVGYFQAALVIRPRSAAVSNNLAIALSGAGRVDEALFYSRQAFQLDPKNASHRSNFAYMLWRAKKFDEAIVEIPKAIPTSPSQDLLYTVLGTSLFHKGRYEEAVAAYREALARNPGYRDAHKSLQFLLISRLGRLDEARVAWRNFLRTTPPDHAAWDGYAELCLFLGENDEYSRACRDLLDRFETSTDPQVAERTSRACLLLPGPAKESARAMALIDRAIAGDKEKPPASLLAYLLVTKALAEYRQDRPERAIALFKGEPFGILQPLPQLILAMAQHRVGQNDAARKTLAMAILSFNWRPSDANTREAWMYQILRREAERMILPDLPAFLEGKYQPRDNDERLALLGVCQFMNRTLAVSRLYAEAFAADPSLAEDFRTGHRSNAARYAALAGCGRGVDAARLGEPERAKWRARAREWLRADLAAWGKALKADRTATRDDAKKRLELWRSDPDFDGLRAPAQLDKVPAGERKDCVALWAEVDVALAQCER